MHLEPSWNLPVVLIAGLASLYLWWVLAHGTVFGRANDWPRDHFPKLIGCPWCCGFWLTGLLLLVTGNYDPVTHLATAGVVGVIGANAV